MTIIQMLIRSFISEDKVGFWMKIPVDIPSKKKYDDLRDLCISLPELPS